MSVTLFYECLGAALLAIGLAGFATRSAALQRLLAVNVVGIGVFMWLVATAYDPVAPDAVPHALVLTGIVVAVSANGFALALLVRLARREAEADDEASPR